MTNTDRMTQFLTAETSQAIRVARVLCISAMMFVHFWPGTYRLQKLNLDPVTEGLYDLLQFELGRASVPLLSLISGVLLFRSLSAGKGSARLLQSKLDTLIVPMVVWSTIYVALLLCRDLAVGAGLPNWDVITWINKLFAITEPPANGPLAFLRDLFVCAIYGLAAWAIAPRSRHAAMALLAVFAALELWYGGIFVLRPMILLFFVIGAAMIFYAQRMPILPFYWVAALWAIYLVARVMELSPGTVEGLLHRAAVAALFWWASVRIATSQSRVRTLVLSIEPFIYLVFCSHLITTAILGDLLSEVRGIIREPYFPLIFLANLPLVILVGFALHKLTLRGPVWLRYLLTGRRPRQRDTATRQTNAMQ